jgi:hypothetical protein
VEETRLDKPAIKGQQEVIENITPGSYFRHYIHKGINMSPSLEAKLLQKQSCAFTRESSSGGNIPCNSDPNGASHAGRGSSVFAISRCYTTVERVGPTAGQLHGQLPKCELIPQQNNSTNNSYTI